MTQVVKQGLRQQQKGLSERLSSVELATARLTFGVQQRFDNSNQRLLMLEEQVEALIELNGRKDVEQIVAEIRLRKAQERSAQEKEALEAGVAKGFIIKAEKVGKRSLLVGHYVGTDGKIQEPQRVQLVMPNVDSNFAAKLLDQAAGFSLDLPDGEKFVLDEAYEVDDEKYREIQKAEAKAAAEASVKAAQEAAAKAAEAAKGDEAADAEPPAEAAPAADAKEAE